jgi:NAD(P)-dependent dehydrogenase (short-subunit alcohol dehydrogenase family)
MLSFSLIHPSSPSFAVPKLLKAKGQLVILNSGAAQVRILTSSEYCISKHAILRFAEFVTLGECEILLFCPPPIPHRFVEYPDIKVFSVDPGSVQTDMFEKFGAPVPPSSSIELSASTIQYLTSGKADYLSGRFVSSTWDLCDVERDWKEKIMAQNSPVSKLSLPA